MSPRSLAQLNLSCFSVVGNVEINFVSIVMDMCSDSRSIEEYLIS